jgi:hypothetical protein
MTLRDLLARSSVAPSFRDAVEGFLRDGRPRDDLSFAFHAPPVKVERTLTQLLVSHPDVPVARVEIEAASGCEFYRGVLRVFTVEGATRTVRFYWDCKWRAVEQGWSDYFGFPDQSRAAREFGHDCFRVWELEPSPELLADA